MTDGNNITIRNLTLQRARVPDHNGAGIRAQGGNLTIENVKFLNNEEGILTTDNPNATIKISGSEFVHNGACEGGCAHGIYTGFIHLLHVEHTRFYETQHTHNVKSKALNTEVIDCDIEDGPKGNSSYQIDVPNGGSLLVEGSTLEKGPNAENHAYSIIIGEEGVRQPTDKIVIRNNTFTNDNEHPTIFLRNLTATPAELIGNKFKGEVRPLDGDGSVSSVRRSERSDFATEFQARSLTVMAGLVPAIHALPSCTRQKTWMAGTGPAMTVGAVRAKRSRVDRSARWY